MGALHLARDDQDVKRFRRYWDTWGDHLPLQIVRRGWQRILHNQMASRLRRALRTHPGIVVSTVPFHLPD